MDITRGYLEDISRPAGSDRSRQRPGSRVSLGTPSSAGSSRPGVDTSNSLEILPPESPALDQQEFDLEVVELFSSDTDSECDAASQSDKGEGDRQEMPQSHQLANSNGHDSDGARDCDKNGDGNRVTAERAPAAPDPLDEIADPKIREAMKKMRQLDRILAKKVVKEKEVKRERLRAHRDMELELRGIQPEGRDEQREVSENASRFLALVPPPSHSEGISLNDEPVDPVFQTQPPADTDSPRSGDRVPGLGKAKAGSQKGDSTDRSGQTEADGKTQRAGGRRSKGKGQDNASHGGSDFIQRNIDLASDAGNVIPMTDDEKKRLEELLQDMEMLADEDTKPSSTAANSLQLAAGVGYVPDANEQQALRDIDAKLKALLPSDDFERISSTTPTQESGFFYQGDVDPGERVLKDTKEDRTQQERLKSIEDELESLETRVEREIYKSPRLSQDKLSDLLEQCSELSSRAATETHSILQASPRSGHGAVSTPGEPVRHGSQEGTQRLAEDVLQELLAQARDSCLSESRLSTATPRRSLDGQQLTSRSDGSVRSQLALVPPSTIQELLRNPRATSSVASTTGTIMDMAERGRDILEGDDLPGEAAPGSALVPEDSRVSDGHSSFPDTGKDPDPDVHRQSELGDPQDGPALPEPLWEHHAVPRRSRQSPQPHLSAGGQSSKDLSLSSVSGSTDFHPPSVSLKSPEPPPSSRKRRSRTRKAAGPDRGGSTETPRESANVPQPPAAAHRAPDPRRGSRPSVQSSPGASESADPPPHQPRPLLSPGLSRSGSRARKARSSEARSSLQSGGTTSPATQRTDSQASANTLVSSSDFEYEDDEAIAGQLLTRSPEPGGTELGPTPNPKQGRQEFGSSTLSRSIEQSVARSIGRFEKKSNDEERFSPPLV